MVMYFLSEEGARPNADAAGHIGLYETELFILKYVARNGKLDCTGAETEWKIINPLDLGCRETSEFLMENGYLSANGELETKGKIELMIEHWPTTGRLLGLSGTLSTERYVQTYKALMSGGCNESLWESFCSQELTAI